MRNKVYISWDQVLNRLGDIERMYLGHFVYGVPKGGMILTAFCKDMRVVHLPGNATVILDDIEDSGKTGEYYKKAFPKSDFVPLFRSSEFEEGSWLVFPWEAEHPSKNEDQPETIEQNITRILQYIGEDPLRPGLIETPGRVIRSYAELFSGYDKDPKDLFKVFKEDKCDEMVVLKDIEFYSTCEHHMIPFFGKAHVAYVPRKTGGAIVGISKLARLVDLYARRLQVQERIGNQVTEALMEHLKPLGAACVIEAKHMCMCARGVNKQNSVMVTSSLTGVFKEKPEVRAEFLNLIR